MNLSLKNWKGDVWSIAKGYNFPPSEIDKFTTKDLKFWVQGLELIDREAEKQIKKKG